MRFSRFFVWRGFVCVFFFTQCMGARVAAGFYMNFYKARNDDVAVCW